jgi:hypothetical protein
VILYCVHLLLTCRTDDADAYDGLVDELMVLSPRGPPAVIMILGCQPTQYRVVVK